MFFLLLELLQKKEHFFLITTYKRKTISFISQTDRLITTYKRKTISFISQTDRLKFCIASLLTLTEKTQQEILLLRPTVSQLILHVRNVSFKNKKKRRQSEMLMVPFHKHSNQQTMMNHDSGSYHRKTR